MKRRSRSKPIDYTDPKAIDKILTLGADPEFLLMNENGSVAYGTDLIGSRMQAQFGVDGAGQAAELRPKPAISPRGLVDNIRKAMRQGLSKFPKTAKYGWVAGGSRLSPIGGHIHFGTNKLSWSTSSSVLSSHLDTFLAVPVLAIENKEEAVYRRRHSGYGQLGDMRAQPWGLEYRTLGSWITSPAVSLGVLSLAKMVVCESIAGKLYGETIPGFSRSAFSSHTVSKRTIDSVWSRIEKMVLYPKYKKDVAIIRDLYAASKSWHAGDIKESWSLLTPKMKAKLNNVAVAKPKKTVRMSAIWGRTAGSTSYTVVQRTRPQATATARHTIAGPVSPTDAIRQEPLVMPPASYVEVNIDEDPS